MTFFEDEDEARDEDNNLNQRGLAPRAPDAMPQSNERLTRRRISLGADYIVYRVPIPYNIDPGVNRMQNRVNISFHRYYISIATVDIVHHIPIPGVNRMRNEVHINVYNEYVSIRFNHRRRLS